MDSVDNMSKMDANEFWTRFGDLCRIKGITQKQVNDALGFQSKGIEAKKFRRTNPSVDELEKMSEIFGVSIEYLVTGRSNFLSSKKSSFIVPLLDQCLSAGGGCTPQEEDVVTGFISVPAEMRRFGRDLAALTVKGDSMEPTFSDGSLVLCDSSGYDGQEGVYAIRYDGNCYIKRLVRKPGKIIVHSDNPIYEEWEVPLGDATFDVIGRVWYEFKRV